MSAALDRVKALLARTLASSGCSEEEMRTSAMIACRLIVEHRLLEDRERVVERVVARPSPASEPRRRRVTPSGRWEIAARFASECSECGTEWDEGDRIAWAPERGAVCLACDKKSEAA